MAIDTIKATAILDGAVDTADLADGAVTTAKVASGAVTSAKLDTDIDVAGVTNLGTGQTDYVTARGSSGTARVEGIGGNTNVNLALSTKGNGSHYFWRNGYGTSASLFLDGTSGYAGINTTTAPKELTIRGTSGSGGGVRIKGTDDSRIEFYNSDAAYSLGSSGGAAIRFHRPSSGHEGIEFEIHDTGVHHKQAMKIHPEGYITKNNSHPMCSATGAPNIRAVSGTGTENTVIAYTNAYVNNGGHYNTGTGIFTCPVAGWYRVQQHCMVDTSGVSQALYITLNVNGGGYIGSYTANTTYNMNMSSMVYYCNANDQIAAMVRHGGKHVGYDSFNVELIG